MRRHALGVIRILVEQKLSVRVRDLLSAATDAFPSLYQSNSSNDFSLRHLALLGEFFHDRLPSYCRDLGFNTNEIMAVVDTPPDSFATLPAQLAAVREFAKLPEAASLSAANKRVANILEKAEGAGEEIGTNGASQEPAESALRAALSAIAPKADALYKSGDFTGYLKSFAALRAPVDEFFDKVMVMAEDKAVRANRLALLRDLRDAMNKVADLSKLAT